MQGVELPEVVAAPRAESAPAEPVPADHAPVQRTLRSLLRELADEALELNGGTWRTVNALIRQPQAIVRAYLGRDRRYTPPFRWFLWCYALYLATLSIGAAWMGLADATEEVPEFLHWLGPAFLLVAALYGWSHWLSLRHRQPNYLAHFVVYCYGLGATLALCGLLFLTIGVSQRFGLTTSWLGILVEVLLGLQSLLMLYLILSLPIRALQLRTACDRWRSIGTFFLTASLATGLSLLLQGLLSGTVAL